jgi:hypothetical protein
MSRGLERLRDTGVHLLLGLGVLGAITLIGRDWEAPESIQISVDEHARVCPICQARPQGLQEPRPREELVASGAGANYGVFRDMIVTDSAP